MATDTSWQPIETAPTNESVLVFVPNTEHYGPGIYRAIQVDMGTGRRWMTTGLHVGRDCGAEAQPTQWMPLPSIPDMQTRNCGRCDDPFQCDAASAITRCRPCARLATKVSSDD
jgi:hypothetical protein